jgi:hypothetical protein
MNDQQQIAATLTRRQLFGSTATGLGTAALVSLLSKDGLSAEVSPSRPKQFGGLPDLPHHPPKVKSVIYLLQNGAPPHVDTFDYKPQMEKFRGEELPESVHKNQRLSTMTQGQKSKAVLPSIVPFRQHGECGRWLSDFLPHTATIVDDATFRSKSCKTRAASNSCNG